MDDFIKDSPCDDDAKYNLGESIAFQVEQEAVEFVEPFHSSGPCLYTMSISTQ